MEAAGVWEKIVYTAAKIMYNEVMDIKQLLASKNFRFSKKYGQNFLTDEAVLQSICSDAHVEGGTALEIGAGAGTLTRMLSQCAQRVVAFEIDPTLKPVLDVTLADRPNVQLVMADVMKYPMPQLEQLCAGPYRVVANIPYYLTSPLIMRFLEEAQQVQSLTLTVQLEVARRLAADPGDKDYGALSVGAQSHGRVQITRVLGRQLFYPQPNVDSAVVNIEIVPDALDISDRKLFRKTVQAAFCMRRKLLTNCLATGFGIGKQQSADIVARCGFAPTCRGEELSVQQFVALYRVIEQEGLK